MVAMFEPTEASTAGKPASTHCVGAESAAHAFCNRKASFAPRPMLTKRTARCSLRNLSAYAICVESYVTWSGKALRKARQPLSAPFEDKKLLVVSPGQPALTMSARRISERYSGDPM